MSEIDLSKAKIGDKFRTRDGCILKYVGEDSCGLDNKYLLEDIGGLRYNFYKYGDYMLTMVHCLDLVEQVFDEPLGTMARDIRTNHEMEEVIEVIKEEKQELQELQRREEVVELADRIFFSERGSAYSFKECIEVAEHSVNMINQYLKEGKLC